MMDVPKFMETAEPIKMVSRNVNGKWVDVPAVAKVNPMKVNKEEVRERRKKNKLARAERKRQRRSK